MSEVLKSVASLNEARGHYDLIKLSHSSWSKDYYLINNTEAITYNGQEYLSFPFAITITPKGELSGASISFLNVDRQIAELLNTAVSTDANESIEMVHKRVTIENDAGDLTVGNEQEQGTFELQSPTVDKESITAGLGFKVSLPYNVGSLTYSKNLFPNLSL